MENIVFGVADEEMFNNDFVLRGVKVGSRVVDQSSEKLPPKWAKIEQKGLSVFEIKRGRERIERCHIFCQRPIKPKVNGYYMARGPVYAINDNGIVGFVFTDIQQY